MQCLFLVIFFFFLASTEQDTRRSENLFSSESHHVSSHIYYIHGLHSSVIEGMEAHHFSHRK